MKETMGTGEVVLSVSVLKNVVSRWQVVASHRCTMARLADSSVNGDQIPIANVWTGQGQFRYECVLGLKVSPGLSCAVRADLGAIRRHAIGSIGRRGIRTLVFEPDPIRVAVHGSSKRVVFGSVCPAYGICDAPCVVFHLEYVKFIFRTIQRE